MWGRLGDEDLDFEKLLIFSFGNIYNENMYYNNNWCYLIRFVCFM